MGLLAFPVAAPAQTGTSTSGTSRTQTGGTTGTGTGNTTPTTMPSMP